MNDILLTSRTAFNRDFSGETSENPSETQPDQALSPQELLRRFVSGKPLGTKDNSLVYDDDYDMDLPEFDKMDKLDRLHAVQENAMDVKDLYSAFNDATKKANADARNASDNARNEPENVRNKNSNEGEDLQSSTENAKDSAAES